MAQLIVQSRNIVRQKNVCDGVPLLEGTRIRVSDIAIEYDFHGLKPEEIAEEFSLSLPDVFTALTYYYKHLGEIRKEIEERKNFFEKVRKV